MVYRQEAADHGAGERPYSMKAGWLNDVAADGAMDWGPDRCRRPPSACIPVNGIGVRQAGIGVEDGAQTRTSAYSRLPKPSSAA